MSTMAGKPNPNKDAGSDFSLYVLVACLLIGFIVVFGYLIYSFFE